MAVLIHDGELPAPVPFVFMFYELVLLKAMSVFVQPVPSAETDTKTEQLASIAAIISENFFIINFLLIFVICGLN